MAKRAFLIYILCICQVRDVLPISIIMIYKDNYLLYLVVVITVLVLILNFCLLSFYSQLIYMTYILSIGINLQLICFEWFCNVIKWHTYYTLQCVYIREFNTNHPCLTQSCNAKGCEVPTYSILSFLPPVQIHTFFTPVQLTTTYNLRVTLYIHNQCTTLSKRSVDFSKTWISSKFS